jgi:1,4-dihydroxy-2-naphthoate polyprenyltransferase
VFIVRLISVIKLGRPAFLIGGLIFALLGVSIAYYQMGTVRWDLWLWGQIIVTLTQLMVHYSNDYFDQAADRANTNPNFWSGGSRVLQKDILNSKIALYISLLLGGAALALSFLVVILGAYNIMLLIILMSGIVFSWSYSAPPLSLHSRGWGEAASVVIIVFLTPLSAYYLQTRALSMLPILALLPLVFLDINAMIGAQISDYDSDQHVGKRNLTTGLGRTGTRMIYLACLAATALMTGVVLLLGVPDRVGLFAALMLPSSLWLVWRIIRGDWFQRRHWQWIAFTSFAILILFAVLEIEAFVSLVHR